MIEIKKLRKVNWLHVCVVAVAMVNGIFEEKLWNGYLFIFLLRKNIMLL